MTAQRTVLCYGDSNTHGSAPMASLTDRRRFPPDERWPGALAAELGPAWRVIEEGLPGRTTVFPDPISGVHMNGLAVLPVALSSHRPIDLVIFMLGTNDLKHCFGVSAQEIALGMRNLIQAVQNSEDGPDGKPPQILVVCPPAVEEVGWLAEMYSGGADKSRQLIGFYAEIAELQGVALLDAGDIIAVSMVDGVHYEAEDHSRLGRAIAAVVKEGQWEGKNAQRT